MEGIIEEKLTKNDNINTNENNNGHNSEEKEIIEKFMREALEQVYIYYK